MTTTSFRARLRLPTRDTDADWRYYGDADPYFGVLTNERFTKANLDDAARGIFFESGQRHIDTILADVRSHLDAGYTPRRAIDFGCGVGRLALPLARVCDSVVGVDISPAMLEEARRNADGAGVTNLELVQADDSLSRLGGGFDLVHSFIVFQHIPPQRGEAIVGQLVDRLNEGGIGVLHFTYASSSSEPAPLNRRFLTRAYAVPFVYSLRNLIKGVPLHRPPMQMYQYDIDRLLCLLQERHCHEIYARFTETQHFNYPVYGVILFFVKRVRDRSEYQ